MNPSFTPLESVSGLIHTDESATVYSIVGQEYFHFMNGTYFVFVSRGVAWHNSEFPLRSGMYGSFNSGWLNTEPGARVMIINAPKYHGMRVYGGPLEAVGRLKYIDGCTDSLLVPPVKLGDPCLNHLHFPIGIDQTMHTHPTVRIGMVFRGQGECVTPWGNFPLTEGMMFVIHPEKDGKTYMGVPIGSHCFRTKDRTMDVVAWHPNSDYGPTDEIHPMINMTFVDGVSANNIVAIRTK